MTEFNTGNPVGSTAPKDLYDNSQNIDNWANGQNIAYPDRLGQQRRSWKGLESSFTQSESQRALTFEASQVGRQLEFDEFLDASAFTWIGDYAAGLVFTRRNQYTVRLGLAYRPGPTATLPFTTTGTWATDAPFLSALSGDDVLRQDLSDSDGATLVGYRNRTLAGKADDVRSIRDFPGATDGQFNSAAAAFTAAEASTEKVFFVPEGTWNAGNVSLTKRYIGPGRILNNGTTLGRDFSRIVTMPAANVTPGLYFGAELSHVDPSEFVVESTVDRQDLDIPYFDYRLIRQQSRNTFKSGSSGYDASIVVPTIPGTAYVKVDDLSPFAVGDYVVVGSYLPNAERKTILNIAVDGTLTMDSNFSSVIGTPGANSIAAVSLSARTNSGVKLTELDVTGYRVGGDFVAETTRLSCGATHNPGRNHAFDRTTMGFTAGDSYAYRDGIYVAGHEHIYADAATPEGVLISGNIFVIDLVKSFIRTRDDGTFGCAWLGTLYKSEGTLPADATHVISGKWKRGLDTTLANFGSTGAAVSMASNQRIYWGSTSSRDLDGFRFWGDVLGPIYAEGRTAGADNLLEINISGSPSAVFRSTGLTVPGTLLGLVTGSTAGGKLQINDANTYFTFDGTTVRLVKNGTVVWSA